MQQQCFSFSTQCPNQDGALPNDRTLFYMAVDSVLLWEE
ncbi:hypothetical protein HCH_05629 [Hahella chejuensis KCTC 2396]|uniref:Uncharacterized protein n=1 Tax=Hahella chejuensis (strain KCTC 2396) TaxID=349521 RepID=Q2SAN7_HAHCH|nr:hypothetical protein HCH_05629 [Hahella chejuensis KCTC 2396]